MKMFMFFDFLPTSCEFILDKVEHLKLDRFHRITGLKVGVFWLKGLRK